MAQLSTGAALSAWLLLLLWMHAWDRELVAEDWGLQRPTFWMALALSAMAVLAELSLLSHRLGETWAWLVALFGVPALMLAAEARVDSECLPLLVAIAGSPVLVLGAPSARLRCASLVVSGPGRGTSRGHPITPYRDIAGFHGPADRRAARRLLARRIALVLWRTLKTSLVWCAVLAALAGASTLWWLTD